MTIDNLIIGQCFFSVSNNSRVEAGKPVLMVQRWSLMEQLALLQEDRIDIPHGGKSTLLVPWQPKQFPKLESDLNHNCCCQTPWQLDEFGVQDILVWKVLCVSGPPFSPSLPSGMQIAKQNTHRTFHTRIFCQWISSVWNKTGVGAGKPVLMIQ